MEQYFDINRIVKITLYDKRATNHKWLPEKQKTWLFGLIKRNVWYSEGWYSNGCYREGYMGDEWDATPISTDSLRESGYIVEKYNGVYRKPQVSIQLTDKCEVNKEFETHQEAKQWVIELIKKSQNFFEINVDDNSTSFLTL